MSDYIGIIITILAIGVVVYLLSGNIKKTMVVVGGWGIYDFADSIYNFVLWPIIQNNYGAFSIVYLTLGAVAMNLPVLFLYHRGGKDLLGVKYLEEVKERELEFANKFYYHGNKIVRVLMYIPTKIFQFVIRLLKKNDVFAFIFLSLFNDSFIATVFLRHGNFDKLNKRDFMIFTGSTLLGCALWGVIVEVVLSLLHIIGGWLSSAILIFG